MGKTIVAFGDSIVEGVCGGIKPEENWLNLLQAKLGNGYKLINAGVGGNSAREAMARYERDVLKHNPDVVLIEFGGNNHDPFNTLRQVSDKELTRLLEAFKCGLPNGCQVIVCTFPPILDDKHCYRDADAFKGKSIDKSMDAQRDIVRKFAADNGYVLLDLYKTIYDRRYELIFDDGVHLNQEGQKVFAQEAYNALMKVPGIETYQLALDEMKKYGLEAKLQIERELPSFEIRVAGGKITIYAPNDLELLYGVYDLAERIGGYYFFEPGRDRFDPARKVQPPKNGVIAMARRPKLRRRGLVQEFPFSEEETPMLLDWMAKNKMNYIETWMKYYDDCKQEWKDMARIRGIEIESGHHNFNYWIPGRKYNATHPEFFAEINGKRIESNDGKSSLLLSEQLCTTNPQLREEIVKNMLAYCDAHPEIKTVAIVPNDGFGWCECKECSKFYDVNRKGDLYSVSEHVYKADKIYHDLVKYIAKRLQEKRPDLTLGFGSYINYSAPSEGFKLEKGMGVSISPYWRCINHEINDKDCPINSHYAEDILAWLRCRNGGSVYIYEYYMGVNFYISLPMIHFHEMFHEVDWYAKIGIEGVITQFHIPHWTVYGMNFVLLARAGRGETEEEALPLLYHILFGKDVEEAKAFYRQVKQLLLNAGHCHIPYPYSLLNRTKLQAYQKLNEMAVALAAKAPEDQFRKELVIWTEYMIRFKQLFDDYHAGKLTEKDIDDFLAWIASHKDTRVFVQRKFPFYFNALRTAMQNGTEWLHFNIGWEDNYIRKHREILGQPQGENK
ncbi:MAG: DUF4838 domain-containing protein [Victivallales bacterium]|nr:DUF4838 domain-containing protein [Victivallales bacterium]